MTTKAVIQTGGKQYLVEPGMKLTIEKLPGRSAGEAVTFEQVLLLIDSGQVTVGTPTVGGARVEGKILEVRKHAKVTGVKFKRRRRYLRRIGHRQQEVMIEVTAVKKDRPGAVKRSVSRPEAAES